MYWGLGLDEDGGKLQARNGPKSVSVRRSVAAAFCASDSPKARPSWGVQCGRGGGRLTGDTFKKVLRER